MIRMFARHTVSDFDAWKRAYDRFADRREAMGVLADAVFRGAESSEDVTVWHDFDDLDSARAFVSSPELEERMKAAGVVGEPQIWFVERDLPA